MSALEIIFWVAIALLVHTHITYPLVLAVASRFSGHKLDDAPGVPAEDLLPSVSLIIAAYNEADVIAEKVRNALALEYPRDRLQIIVASDGSSDQTCAIAESEGADLVLDLPRAGKIATQNAAVEQASGEVLAFSDANAYWHADALRLLVAPLAVDQQIGYVTGQVRFLSPDGDNLEGIYWRYEMKVRELESSLAGVTAGNGGIYAVRDQAYRHLGPSRSHDLSFPFELAKQGWRSVYAPLAVASEKMVPTIEGEFNRKRRMMVGLWDIVIGDGMLSPRGYSPMYAFEIASHRGLRYASPFLHLIALGANIAILGDGAIYSLTLGLQIGLLLAAAFGRFSDSRLAGIAYYYVSVTASIALGFWDRMRNGRPAAWEKSEGTR